MARAMLFDQESPVRGAAWYTLKCMRAYSLAGSFPNPFVRSHKGGGVLGRFRTGVLGNPNRRRKTRFKGPPRCCLLVMLLLQCLAASPTTRWYSCSQRKGRSGLCASKASCYGGRTCHCDFEREDRWLSATFRPPSRCHRNQHHDHHPP
jgi:hypothetical protein